MLFLRCRVGATRIFAVSIKRRSIGKNGLKLQIALTVMLELFTGECKNFSPKCGTTYTKGMCVTNRQLMEKYCPKMCNLCSEYSFK